MLDQHSSVQLLQNLSTALPHVIKNIQENWDNVQSIHIKTSSSASLPIWNCRLDEKEGGRWDGLTRVPIPDDPDKGVKKGKKRALESLEEIVEQKKRGVIAKKSTSISRPSTSGPSKGPKPTLSAASVEPPKGTRKTLTPESLGKLPTNKVFHTGNSEGRPSAPKTTALRKSSESKPSPDFEHPSKKSKSQTEKPSETKTVSILKSPKNVPESSAVSGPVKQKRVKFAAKLPNLKTKKGKALGFERKKVRSGVGREASAKDRILGKKAAVQ